MKKNILVYGLISGLLLCANFIIVINLLYNNPEMETNDILGYAVMVLVFSLIYFGVRNYRDKQLDGSISFGKAFKTGVLIALMASTVYVVVWLFYYYLFVPDFLDVYIQHVLSQTPPEELAATTEQMEGFKEMYKNPLFVILITYMEVFPIGLVVALISGFILKKKKDEPKTNEHTMGETSPD